MTEAPFRVEHRAKGVVWLTLDRPEIHNAFDDRLIAELTKELEDLGADAGVRVVVLTGAGRSFSAGRTSTGCAAPRPTARRRIWPTPGFRQS